MKKVSDERLIELLVIHGSVKNTATVLGISESAIYKRFKDEEFRTKYDAMQGLILTITTRNMVECLSSAVNTLKEIVEDKTAPSGVRVASADALLRHSVRYIEVSTLIRRIETLEELEGV